MLSDVIPTSNDLLITAYRKRLGFFSRNSVIVAIPFPISLFSGGREKEIQYSDIDHMTLMINNSEYSVYIVEKNGNGKTKGYSIGLGLDMNTAIRYFEKACELIRNINADTQFNVSPRITEALTKLHVKSEIKYAKRQGGKKNEQGT